MKSYKGISVNGNCIEVFVEHGKIKNVTDIPYDHQLPVIGIPLVDGQNNGALGINYNQIPSDIEALQKMVNFYRSHGVGKILLTTTTCPSETIMKSAKEIIKHCAKDPNLDAFFAGVFHEGIFMSKKEGWRGSHKLKFIMDPNYEVFKETNRCFENKIKVVNIAPEEPGGMKFIEKAVGDGILVSLGHAFPNAEEVKEAVKLGATLVTHFGNGANPMIHRHKNPFWSYLAHEELTLGIIADGHHLPKELIQAAICAKGPKKLNFVSDCASIAGMPPGEYGDEEMKIVLEPDGFLHVKDQEILAAAWFQLDRGVEYLCKMGWTLTDAWKQCSEIPAKNLNIKVNSIEKGMPANFVLSRFSMDTGLKIEKVLYNGNEHPVLPVIPVYS